jgi:predicted Zn-dependent peptidase
MMKETVEKHTLTNGMVVLGEPMADVASAAFNFLVPAGASTLPDGCCGASNLITDWVFRGAGKRDSRQLIESLDGLGLHRSSNAMSSHIGFGAAMEASSLDEAIGLYADIILSPTLDEKQFELSKELTLSDIIGLADDPHSKVMQRLFEEFYPDPFGRPAMGKLEEVQSLTPAKTAAILKERFNMSEAIFSVAGKYDLDKVCGRIEELFGAEQANYDIKPEAGKTGEKYTHIQHDGAQVHIGLMTGTVAVSSEYYYDAMAAVSILSGGMSSRLFTEVREKRGLCYAVGASYNTQKGRAGISCYAGTTPDKAQETVDVIMSEFNRLSEDISEDEAHRAKVGLKSSLIMSSESSSARAGGIARDHYLLGRVRSIEEIKEKIQGISVKSIMDFLNANRFEDYTVVSIGPKGIKV